MINEKSSNKKYLISIKKFFLAFSTFSLDYIKNYEKINKMNETSLYREMLKT